MITQVAKTPSENIIVGSTWRAIDKYGATAEIVFSERQEKFDLWRWSFRGGFGDLMGIGEGSGWGTSFQSCRDEVTDHLHPPYRFRRIK
jgi:hypothetical protein